MKPDVEYLGHKISSVDRLQPTQEKVHAIAEAPPQQNVTKLCSFLGLINYYGRIIPNFVTTLALYTGC